MNEIEIKAKLKDFICNNLGVEADSLEYDTQLFDDEEIVLDSVDAFEIISFVDREYGVQMASVGKEHFLSIERIAKYINENKKAESLL